MRSFRLVPICLLTLLLAAATTMGVATYFRRPPTEPPKVIATPLKTQRESANEDCENRRRALLELPLQPGVPSLEAVRHELVARAKSEPVVFLEPPVAKLEAPDLAELRERLHRDPGAWQAFNATFTQVKGRPDRLRQVLLTEGYLYAERPNLAALIANGVSLNQLFSEPELDVVRGDITRRAVRKHRDYVWADGLEAGQTARLWLFDRVYVHGQNPGRNKHVSVAGLRERMGATRIEVEALTNEAATAHIVYGEHSLPALLAIRDGHFELDCEVIPPSLVAEIDETRLLASRQRRVLERLRAAVEEQVSEGLPFDEPKTEEGQQDGKLRQEWRTAYKNGLSTYEFNGDEYHVFGAGGIPRIPQVCVDFITDTWERMAGTRWAKRGEARQRQMGRLDFDTLGIENRRSVENLIDFAVAHPEWFDLMLVPESERITFGDRSRFFQRLLALRTDFQPGDVVAILGPRDDEKLHYHSFFILADDPLTSMPTLVAANAGRPRIRTWEAEMQNAPRRSIIARIRPRLSWLETIVGTGELEATQLAAK